jgi:hypothetical protein
MSQKTKKKLCWNCEGNVSLKNENCPYCGVSLTVSPLLSDVKNPFAPPYRFTEPSSHSIIPASPYLPSSESESHSEDSEHEDSSPSEPLETDELKATTISLLLLLFGTVFLIFGIILWLFSDEHRIFILSWNGKYWFVYLLLGIPMSYFGWRFSRQADKSEAADGSKY